MDRNDIRASAFSDEKLFLDLTRQRDDRSFAILSRRHIPGMLRYARCILRNNQDAEDAVQETFFRILRAAGDFKPGALFAPWAFRILRNHCLDFLRKQRPLPLTEATPVPADPAPDALIRLEKEESAEKLKKALETLPVEDREAVSLRMYGELSFAAIGESLGIREDAAKKRVYRALQALKKSLQATADVPFQHPNP